MLALQSQGRACSESRVNMSQLQVISSKCPFPETNDSDDDGNENESARRRNGEDHDVILDRTASTFRLDSTPHCFGAEASTNDRLVDVDVMEMCNLIESLN